MNVNQRTRILQNIDSLVDLTDFDKLSQACYQNHLLSSTMIQNICLIDPRNTDEFCDEEAIKRERHKKLFVKITKRGPDAFEKLRRILVALKCSYALNILFSDNNNTVSISSSKKSGEPTHGSEEINNRNAIESIVPNGQLSVLGSNHTNVLLHEYEGLIQPQKSVIVRIASKIIIDPTIGTYLMESKNNRGLFFAVNSGADHADQDEDINLLYSLFKQLGFKLYAYSNITLNQLLNLLEEFSTSDKIMDIECFVLVVKAGYRLINGVQWITLNDGSVVKMEQIQRYFYHQNCRALAGKPKIFIYPCCEIPNKILINSNKIQTYGVSCESGFKHISQLSDVINCYATTRCCMDDRDNKNYSRYIQSFVDVIAEKSHDTHFENMLKIIQDRVAKLSISNGQLQMASYDNIGFNKILYFNPGLTIN